MKSKNVPKCIREGIFCLMTGALVFAGNSMNIQAAEGDAADLPQDDSISNDVNTAQDNAVAEAALKTPVGARALQSIMSKVLRGVMYKAPGIKGLKRVVINSAVVNEGAEPLIETEDGNEQSIYM